MLANIIKEPRRLELFRDSKGTWIMRDLSDQMLMVISLFGTNEIPTPFFGKYTFDMVKDALQPKHPNLQIIEVEK